MICKTVVNREMSSACLLCSFRARRPSVTRSMQESDLAGDGCFHHFLKLRGREGEGSGRVAGREAAVPSRYLQMLAHPCGEELTPSLPATKVNGEFISGGNVWPQKPFYAADPIASFLCDSLAGKNLQLVCELPDALILVSSLRSTHARCQNVA